MFHAQTREKIEVSLVFGTHLANVGNVKYGRVRSRHIHFDVELRDIATYGDGLVHHSKLTRAISLQPAHSDTTNSKSGSDLLTNNIAEDYTWEEPREGKESWSRTGVVIELIIEHAASDITSLYSVGGH